MATTTFVNQVTPVVAAWLNDVNDATHDDIINVKNSAYGAVGDGVADDTAAMNLAHATGKVVYYPAGTYRFSTLTSFATGGIVGAGAGQTILSSTNVTGANLITYTGTYGSFSAGTSRVPRFHDFTLMATYPTKATGAGIQINPTTGENSYADFRNVTFTDLPIGIDFIEGSLWKVTSCNFLACGVAGIQVANTNSDDSGDSVVMGCMFNNPYATGAGILQKSSGGLKIVGNKFLGGAQGYLLAYDATANTGLLVISGNSIENMATAGISFTRTSGTATFVGVVISGNQFGGSPKHILSSTTSFLSDISITGNICTLPGTGSPAFVDFTNVSDFIVSGNVIRGSGGTPTGIVSTTCGGGRIGTNRYSSLTNAFTVSGGATTCVPQLLSQSGSSTTGTGGYAGLGPLFVSADTVVTFPVAFLTAPAATDITLTSGSSNGTIGGFITAGPTTTGFTYKAISAVTGVAAIILWQEDGVY